MGEEWLTNGDLEQIKKNSSVFNDPNMGVIFEKMGIVKDAEEVNNFDFIAELENEDTIKFVNSMAQKLNLKDVLGSLGTIEEPNEFKGIMELLVGYLDKVKSDPIECDKLNLAVEYVKKTADETFGEMDGSSSD